MIKLTLTKTYLMEDGKSPKTIESYIGDVTGLVSYLETMAVEFDGSLKKVLHHKL